MNTLKYLVSFFVVMGAFAHATQINIYNKLGRDSSVMTNGNGAYKNQYSQIIQCNCGAIAGAAVGVGLGGVFGAVGGGTVLAECASIQATRWAPEQIPNQTSSWGICAVNEIKLEAHEAGTCFKGRSANEYFYSIKVPGGAIWYVDLIPVSAVPAGITIRRML